MLTEFPFVQLQKIIEIYITSERIINHLNIFISLINSKNMQDFKKLEVWKLSFELGKKIYKITSNFPKEEIYSLTSQLRRCSLSISANIAEGTGRNSDKDFLRFLYIAMGSLKESENFILMSKDFDYITQQQLTELITDMQITGAKLSSLIKTIKQDINSKRQAKKATSNKQQATSDKLSDG